MRLSEKTIEINFCSQVNKISSLNIVWFGLTQRQEARAGFDVITKLMGRLLIFQFKASNNVLKNSSRQFRAPHDQMMKLKKNTKSSQRSVFYVFPNIGTTFEFAKDSNLLRNTWLLDVDTIPNLSPPTTKLGRLRKGRYHYIDINPPKAVIHSEPVEVSLINSESFIGQSFPAADGIRWRYGNQDFERFWGFCQLLAKPSLGAMLLE
jgi:hypothetical protein